MPPNEHMSFEKFEDSIRKNQEFREALARLSERGTADAGRLHRLGGAILQTGSRVLIRTEQLVTTLTDKLLEDRTAPEYLPDEPPQIYDHEKEGVFDEPDQQQPK